jgi:hypothetical protein
MPTRDSKLIIGCVDGSHHVGGEPSDNRASDYELVIEYEDVGRINIAIDTFSKEGDQIGITAHLTRPEIEAIRDYLNFLLLR